jgi:phytoene desaturase
MKVSVIGSGFSGLAAAATMAIKGYEVHVFEKNSQPGGRARQLKAEGFTFDMGPTWYWLPDVFEKFFEKFDKTPADFYTLTRLDPGYRMFFGKNDFVDIPATQDALFALFESLEPGSSGNLKKFLAEAAFKYKLAMNEFIYKPGISVTEFFNWSIISGVLKVNFFKSISKYIRSLFKNPRIIKILEFPVIFLGAAPADTPSLYSLMNHADLTLGTWYPMGGMHEVIKGMVKLNESLGVKINYDLEVVEFKYHLNTIDELITHSGDYKTDVVVAGADYNFVDQKILASPYREYNAAYWKGRKMAPSALLYYIGLDKRLHGLEHHNLFFDTDFEKHAEAIYKQPEWPSSPAIYVSCSTITDSSGAPEGNENLIILIPVAAGLEETPSTRKQYLEMVLDRMENNLGQDLRNHIVYQKSYAASDFINDYHSFKGNAYGLSNTLLQTAFLKPKIKSSKLINLFYCGQLTVPGPGVPPSIISGEIAGNLVNNYFKS